MDKVSKPRRPRIRRTPDAARALILDAAERRLGEFGLAGLAIADVARDAGLSHATLLHHFGSSEGMRVALVERMVAGMLSEVTALLEQDDFSGADGGFFERLFATLSGGGHARLIGWLHLMSEGDPDLLEGRSREMFEVVLGSLRERLMERGASPEAADTTARHVVLLVVSSALGFGIARSSLLEDVGLTESEEPRFARWLGELVRGMIVSDAGSKTSA